jgi:SNF2 family DNA or RNA helicase
MLENVEQQCILVDSPDHTYITDHYIVTHNTLPPIAYAAKHKLKTLVICPASLKLNWRKEIANFSNEKSYIYKYIPSKKSGNVNHKKEDSLFHIINYESIQSFIKLEYKHKCSGNLIVPGQGSKKCGMEIIDLTKKHKSCPDCKNTNSFKTKINGLAFVSDKSGAYIDPDDYDLVVIDEFHRIKSVKTDWTQIIKRAFRDSVDKKILISGTAIKSRPMEFFSGLNFLDSETWNSSHDFGVKYCAAYETNFGWDYSGASNLEELFSRISPYFLRRHKKEVLSQLPPKTYTEIEIELTPSERTEYNRIFKEMKKTVLEDGTEEEKDESYLEKIHKLKQFTGEVKMRRMIEDGVVDDISSNGDKLVVMSDYQIIAETLNKEYKDSSVLHTGSMNLDEKQNSVDKFQEDKSVSLFCGMIGASGVGITLTEASKLIFLGLAWTSSDMEQCEDRIHRATTTHDNIQIIKYICVDTIDEDINELLKSKAQVVSKVLDNKDYVDKTHRGDESILKSLINRLK